MSNAARVLSVFEQVELQQQVLDLSAQVEVMREALRNLTNQVIDSIESDGETEMSTREAHEALSITPSAALLSHDNEVAAKALEEAQFAVMSAIGMSDAVSRLREMAAAKRKGEQQ